MAKTTRTKRGGRKSAKAGGKPARKASAKTRSKRKSAGSLPKTAATKTSTKTSKKASEMPSNKAARAPAKAIAKSTTKTTTKTTTKPATKATTKPARTATRDGAAKKALAPSVRGETSAPTAAKPSARSTAGRPASPTASRRANSVRSRAPGAQPGGRSTLGAALRRAVRTVGRAARRLVGAPKPEDAGSGHGQAPMVAPAGVAVTGRMRPRYAEVLTAEALTFLAELHRKFDGPRKELLAARAARQARYDAGALPDFLSDTQAVRDGAWTVAPIPADLLDRRVEITGPVDRRMIVNALNSGANVFMADFEDAHAPTWSNTMEGQINLKDRWDGRLDFTEARTGKQYKLGNKLAVMIVRPRGWHLDEVHLTVDGEPISGALFDFGLYVFHNARAAIAQNSGPYVYLPKLESHQEARLWNEVFIDAQQRLGLPNGTIKATVLIETLPAAFEMDEILWELRDHIAGLNAGRWDLIFSFIKTFARNPGYVLPDRSQLVMGQAFLGAYAALLVKTCHRRGAFAMGGMAAQIPIKNDQEANETAFALVRADKEREVREGHDGTWVAHPGLVPVAREVFDRMMPQPNQLDVARADVQVVRGDLLRIHEGTKTEEGFRLNIRVGVQYIAAWLSGRGAVPIYNLMEDAATAEISRAQVWQWLRYQAELDTGVTVTADFFRRAMEEELERVEQEVGGPAFRRGRFREAAELFERLSLAEAFEPFLTIPAYKLIA